MNFSGIGDLAQNLMLRRQGAGLKAQMTKLTQELTTGQSQDTSARVRGDFGAISSIERHIGRLNAFQQVRDGLSVQMSGVQSSLGAIQSSLDGYGASLISSATLGQADVFEVNVSQASDKLGQVVSYLNTQHSGRSLFSGIATDQEPLASAEAILAELRTVAASATDAADLVAQVDSWFFDVGGGFEASAYRGSTASVAEVSVSGASQVSQPAKADDTAFRNVIRGLALSALASEGLMPASPSEVFDIITDAGQSILAGQVSITSLQGKVGEIEAQIENENIAGRSENTVLQEASSRLTGIDPYEAAAELEAVQFQIETLYVLTARMSQLRLTDYLR